MNTPRNSTGRWLQSHGRRRIQSAPISDDHRLLWGWVRLVLGLTQMSFSVTAAYLLAVRGLQWRVGVAALVATVAAIVSRFLYAGRPDPRLTASLDKQGVFESNAAQAEVCTAIDGKSLWSRPVRGERPNARQS